MSNQLECPICPYCGEPLVSKTKDIFAFRNTTVWYCQNPECEESEDFIGTREIWESFTRARNIFAQGQENTKELAIKLIQSQKDLGIARKALDVAVDALKEIDWCAQDYTKAQEALVKITALTKGGDND